MAAKNMKKRKSVIALVAGSWNEYGICGDERVAYQPLFVYNTSNRIIHNFMKIVMDSFNDNNKMNICFAETNNINAKLLSGFPRVTNVDEVVAAVSLTHSKKLANNFRERFADRSKKIDSGYVDPPDEPDLVAYPGQYTASGSWC